MTRPLFPMKNVSISRRAFVKGTTHEHLNAIDINGESTGKEYGRSPCRCKVLKILPFSSTGFANTVIIGTCDENGNQEKVLCADGQERVLSFAYTHDNSIRVKLNQIVNQLDIVYMEGTTGNATGNHIHFEIGEGWQYTKVKNSYGDYSLKNLLYAYNVLWLDSSYHQIVNYGLNGYTFKYLENEIIELKYGLNKVLWENQEVYIYKQKQDEDIGLVSTDGLNETKTLDKFNYPGISVKCIVNASYFENRNVSWYGQVYGREQGFTKDNRPDQPEYLDTIISNDGVMESGDFASWEWLKEWIKLGVSPAVVLLQGGYSVTNVSSAVGNGKYTATNTQTLLMQDKECFYLAVVKGKLNGSQCRNMALKYGMQECVMLDSGGSSQMIVDDSWILKTGRKLPNGICFYTKDLPSNEDDPEVKSIGKINVSDIGLYVRKTLTFTSNKPDGVILGFIKKGDSVELVDFIKGIQNDGYQWVKVKYNNTLGYCQYDSKVYWIEIGD